MAKYSEALIALWDGFSSETKHMIREAERLRLKIFIFFVYD